MATANTKEIGIKLTISSQGEDKVLKNLTELEQELVRLQEKLKTQSFGSGAFKETAKNIQTLKSFIADVDKSTEGLDAAKRFTQISQTIGFMTSAFQAASGAIGLFISDEEDLAKIQQQQAKALNVVNLALGVNNALIQYNEAASTRKKIADLAGAAATKVAAAATAAWNAVLALNPVVAIAAGVAALTAGIYLLVKATSAGTDAEEQANAERKIALKLEEELLSVRKNATTQQEYQYELLTDNVSTRNLELKAIEDLKKEYPGFNAFISREGQLTDQGNEFLKTKIALLQAEAVVQDLIKRKNDLQIEGTKNINDELQRQAGFWGNLWDNITAGFNPTAKVFQQTNKLIEAGKEQSDGLKVINDLLEKENKNIDELLGALKPYEKTLKDTAAAEAAAAKAAQDRQSIYKNGNIILENAIKEQKEYLELLKQIQAQQLLFDNNIIGAQEKLIAKQEEILAKRNAIFTSKGEELRKQLKETFFVLPPTEQLENYNDAYKALFETIAEGVLSGDVNISKNLGFEDLVDYAASVNPKILLVADALKKVSEKGKEGFVDYFNTIQPRIDEINKSLGATEKERITNLKDLSDVEDFYYEQVRDRVKNGKTLLQIEQETTALINSRFGLESRLAKIEEERKNTAELLSKTKDPKEITDLQKRLELLNTEKETLAGINAEILTGVKNSSEYFDKIDQVNKKANENYESIIKNVLELGKKLNEEQTKQLAEFFKNNAIEYEALITDIFTNLGDYLELVGREGVEDLIDGLKSGLKEIDGLNRQQLEKLFNDLTKLGDELGTKLGEENPFADLLDEISKRLKKLPTESEEAFAKTIDNIKKIADEILSAFNDISARLTQIVASQNSLLLEQLSYQEAQALATIGNATEREKQEQEKIQKEYAKRRFEVEKKARIQELQFAFANATASGAGAVINALGLPAPPPLPQIYAGVIAALTAAQLAVINQQLQFTQSKSYIARRGGLISGASHEGGGVPMLMEGGEFVLNKEAVNRFGNEIQSISNATGGKLAIDDSRIVQAIASQNIDNKAPLKAYVLYNDIEDTTKLNKRISQLSKL